MYVDNSKEQQIYQYVRQLTHVTSDEAIRRFYLLMWDGNIPDDINSHTALRNLASAPDFRRNHLEFINRCYYTILNPWHLEVGRHDAIKQLILWPEQLPSNRAYGRATKQIREALQAYAKSDYYTVLKRHNKLLENSSDAGRNKQAETLGDHLNKFPILYVSSTQTPDIEQSSEKLNSSLENKRDKKIVELRQHLKAYIELHKHHSRRHDFNSLKDELNPTSLATAELNKAIKWYQPKRRNSFQKRAWDFRKEALKVSTLGEYKNLFYEAVVFPFIQEYAKAESWAGERYYTHEFKKIILNRDEDDSMPAVKMSVLHMFHRVLNSIIHIDPSSSGDCFFEQLIRGAGHSLVTSILINVVLTCRMARFDLEKSFARLFTHFEHTKLQLVRWFVQALEHINVAIALNARGLGYYINNRHRQVSDLDSIELFQ